jgi:DNA-binding MarR family transcriptional regulator
MIDKQPLISNTNLRSLILYLGDGMDARLAGYRKGTRYEKVRASDVKVFTFAYRTPRTISELSRMMNISRQAVHASVHRLRELKVVDLVPVEGDKRERLVTLTDRGQHAQRTAVEQLEWLEAEVAEVLGNDGLEQFREMLVKLEARFALYLDSKTD